MVLFRFSFIAVAACLLRAQDSASPAVTLQDAIRQAVSASPQRLAGESRVAVAEGLRKQAGLAPNPRLFLQSEDLRPGGRSFSFPNSTEDYVYASQIIETAGKRARRVEVARDVVHRAGYEQDLLLRQIRARVAATYWNASSAQAVVRLYRQSLETYEQDLQYSRNRVAEGQMAEADLIRVELERDRVRQQSLAASRDADAAMIQLYRAMARTDFRPIVLTSPIENQPALPIPEVEQVLAARPEMLLARETVSQAEANTRLQKANSVPDPDVFFGYKRNVGVDTLYAAVQITLPVFNRNQGNIESASAQLRVAQAELAATRLSIQAELEGAIRAYRSLRELIAALPATQARASEAARLAREAYRLGGIDLLRLLDAERVRIDTELSFYRALAQFQQSAVELSLVSGGDLTQ